MSFACSSSLPGTPVSGALALELVTRFFSRIDSPLVCTCSCRLSIRRYTVLPLDCFHICRGMFFPCPSIPNSCIRSPFVSLYLLYRGFNGLVVCVTSFPFAFFHAQQMAPSGSRLTAYSPSGQNQAGPQEPMGYLNSPALKSSWRVQPICSKSPN